MSNLTDLQIRQWIKAGERFEGRSDGNGLTLRYRSVDAAPMWRFRYRFVGKQRVMDLGSYAVLSLADARKKARELRAQVALGHDVAGEKRERKQAALAKLEAARCAVTVGQVADDYFERIILGRWKHPNIVRSRIERDIKPAFGKMPIAEVRPANVSALLAGIVDRGAPTIANDCLRWVRRIFNFAVKREYCLHNPAAAFDLADAGGKEESRTRWLSEAELIKLFAAMKKAKGWAHENTLTVKLLLMLATRKGELIAARINEFDLERGLWHLPAERTKTGEALDIPLPTQAVEIVRDLIRLAAGSAWLLPARKMQSRMVPYISPDTLNVALAQRIRPLMKGAAAFSPHDFRRTARTHLEALGVAPHIAERCLNHKIRGVVGIYNRHDYLDERREALQRWADCLSRLEEKSAVDEHD